MSRSLLALGRAPTPERPGPGPMPDALVREIQLTVGRRVHGLLEGDLRSALLGRGTELAQVRPYAPGDDVRLIDWNVTARTGETHVRVHMAERVLVTWLVVDATPSMRFGTGDRRKDDVALGAAFAVGRAASARGNRVGVLTFGGGPATPRPPRQGRVGMLGLAQALVGEEDEGAGHGVAADLAGALAVAGAVARQRSLVAVVSDFRGPVDWRARLVDLAGRHVVLAVEVRDPREQELPAMGELTLVDPESGRRLRVDTSDAALRTRFAAAAAEERARVAEAITSAGARHVVLSTEGDWLRHLATFLRTRRR